MGLATRTRFDDRLDVEYSEVVARTLRYMDNYLNELHKRQPGESAIDFAKRLNTYKKHDRTEQYQDASTRAILRDLNGLAKAHREFKEKVVMTVMAAGGAVILFLGGELIKCLK